MKFPAYDLLSVGVITKNRPADLAMCVLALLRQSQLPAEILVIDGSSDSKTKKELDKVLKTAKKNIPSKVKFTRIRYIKQRKKGISNARNLVLQYSKNNLIGFIDDDCEADSSWVKAMAQFHKKNPEAVVVQGQCLVVPYHGIASQIYQSEYNAWLKHNFDNKGLLVRTNIENSSLKRNLLAKTTRFDEDKRYYYCDDIDFSYQVLTSNGKMFYNPQAITKIKRRRLMDLLIKRLSKGYSAAMLDIKWEKFQNQQVLILKKTPYLLKKTDPVIKQYNHLDELPNVNKLIKWLIPVISFLYVNLYKLSYNYTQITYSNSFNKGKVRELSLLSTPYPHEKKDPAKLPSSTIGIIVQDSKSLTDFIPLLKLQSMKPEKVIFLIKKNDLASKEKIQVYYNLMNLEIVESENNQMCMLNKMMELCKTDLLCVTTSYDLPSYYWNESYLYAHRNNPDIPVIQGQKMFSADPLKTGLIRQFLWQTLMRNSLIPGKDYYQEVIEGSKKNNGFNIIDIDNFSIKVNRKTKIRFNENESEIKSAILLASNLAHLGNPVYMEANAKTLSFTSNIKHLLSRGYQEGLGLTKNEKIFIKNQSNLVSWNIPKKIGAFILFGLKRKAYLQLPIILTIYITYLISFYIGILSQRNK